MSKLANIPVDPACNRKFPSSYLPGPITHLMASFVSLNELSEATMASFSQLTLKEKSVLKLVAEGLSNPQIAERLAVSRATVQNHRANIRCKLDINSEVDYVKIAVAHDLISL